MINVFFVLYKTQLRKLKTFSGTVRSLSVRVAMVTTSAKGSKSLYFAKSATLLLH